MSRSQTVFRLPSKGAGVEAISETSEPVPAAQPHEVVLKIHATTLNYRDLVIANGIYPFPVKDNVVPCSDAAGEIVEVGDSVKGIAKGDWAIANFDISNLFGPQQDWLNGLGGPIDGVLAEYVALPASAIVKVPKSTTLSWPQIAALVCTGTTVWNALYGNVPLKPGQTVLAIGTGGVSMTGMLLAKAAGAKTIITSSSDEKLQLAKEKYQVDFTINYRTHPEWSKEVLKFTNGQGVDFILENGGAGTIAESLACIKKGGQIAVIGFLAQPKEMPDVTAAVLDKGCIVRGINVGAKQLTEDLVNFACSNNLCIHIERTYRFDKEEIRNAFKELEQAGHVGKIAIQIT